MNFPVEIIPSNFYLDRLYWISDTHPPRNQQNSCFICIDNVKLTQDLQYQPFAQDFGPLNLAMTYRFCSQLERLLQDSRYTNLRIFHYCSDMPAKRSNSAYLMGAFQILVLGRTAKQAWSFFQYEQPFKSFRDASQGPCFYECSILHCLQALERAVRLNWFNYRSFDLQDYEYHEKVQNGDLNWIIPQKFIAFSAPSQYGDFRPEDYVPIFKKLQVTAVVRLNEPTYQPYAFRQAGINHYDLFFPDGSTPDESIIQQFLDICQQEKTIAVHCKAGLGRTGTLIGCYAIKHHNFPAQEFIAWCRICRPGSVLGPQQQFLIDFENQIKSKGDFKGRQRSLDMSVTDYYKGIYGEKGQAERLLSAKRVARSTNATPFREAEYGTVRNPFQSISQLSREDFDLAKRSIYGNFYDQRLQSSQDYRGRSSSSYGRFDYTPPKSTYQKVSRYPASQVPKYTSRFLCTDYLKY